MRQVADTTGSLLCLGSWEGDEVGLWRCSLPAAFGLSGPSPAENPGCRNAPTNDVSGSHGGQWLSVSPLQDPGLAWEFLWRLRNWCQPCEDSRIQTDQFSD